MFFLRLGFQSAISLARPGPRCSKEKRKLPVGNLNAEVIAALKFIRPGATVFDIGANKGEWSRAIQKRVGDLRLFLFEPQATCAPYLRIDGAILTQAAVGEADRAHSVAFPGRRGGQRFTPH